MTATPWSWLINARNKIWVVILCLIVVVALALAAIVLWRGTGPVNIQAPVPAAKAPTTYCNGTEKGTTISCQHAFCAEIDAYPATTSALLPEAAVSDSPPAFRTKNLALWHEWHDGNITMSKLFTTLKGEVQC